MSTIRKRTYKSGAWSWIIDYYDPDTGERHRISLGQVSRQQADRVRQQIESKITLTKAGVTNFSYERNIKLRTLKDYCIGWSKNNVLHKTHEFDIYAFEKLEEHFGNCQMRSITVQKLLDWKSRLNLSEMSSSIIIRRLQGARH